LRSIPSSLLFKQSLKFEQFISSRATFFFFEKRCCLFSDLCCCVPRAQKIKKSYFLLFSFGFFLLLLEFSKLNTAILTGKKIEAEKHGTA
jgi:hypothetical protein